MVKVSIEKQFDSNLTIRTVGLSTAGHPEILVEFDDLDLREEAETFLNHVADYLTNSGRKLRPGETMAYGYWITRFQDAGPNLLEVWEYCETAKEFVKGGSLTLRFWKDQHALCKKYGGDFQPPTPDKLTVISKGVLEGLPVQGVRYPSPEHMSGWWITTDQYDGNIDSLMHEHTYHVTAHRPELAKYLALPFGFRFDLSSFEDIWFDEKVAKAAI
jgi:hypothetical protein